jgi:hypothetical protein
MLHKREAVSFFPRIVEGFAKKPSGKVDHRIWMVMFESYQFGSCKKCSAPSLFVDSHWTKTTDPDEALSIKNEVLKKGFCASYKPKRMAFPSFNKVPFPAWTHDLDEPQMLIFWEVYTAISQGLYGLAMMGIRSIIDSYANRTIGDIGGFAQKLKKLREEGHISLVQYSQLEVVIEAGNAAAHRGHRCDSDDIQSALAIVEGLLAHERYGEAIEKLRAKTPSRSKC